MFDSIAARTLVALLISLAQVHGQASAQFIGGFPPGVFSNKAALDPAGSVASPVETLAATATFFGSPSNTITSAASAHAVSAGQLVVGYVFDGNAGVTCGTCTYTDTKGNTYTMAAGPIFVQNGGPPNGWLFIYFSFITTPLTTSDTFTYTGPVSASASFAIMAYHVTGYTSGIDSGVTNSTSNNFAASYTVSGLAAGTVSGELNMGYAFSLGTMGSTPAGFSSSGMTTASFLAANIQLGWKINAGTSAQTFAGTAASQWVSAIIVAFKP